MCILYSIIVSREVAFHNFAKVGIFTELVYTLLRNTGKFWEYCGTPGKIIHGIPKEIWVLPKKLIYQEDRTPPPRAE
jgi:hypothetical protein